MEANHGLSFQQETFLTIRRDRELVGIELQNGHIERYACEPMSRAKSLEIYGADKIQNI